MTTFTIPNDPAVRHHEAWLTGIDLGRLPARTSVPFRRCDPLYDPQPG